MVLLPAGDPIVPLPRAHAHNDYNHARPLLDALHHGFGSVEADIFLTPEGHILVGHDQVQLQPERTLEALYLKPLQERARRNRGKIYPNGPTLMLLIDIKTEARSTYAALDELLRKYADLLTEVRDGVVVERAVTVVVSGNRPSLEELARQSPRYAGYDGRLSDLDRVLPAHLMPWISDNWALRIHWEGKSPLPEPERQRIRDIDRRAHGKGRKVRFWATPEKAAVWDVLIELDVDYINSDKLDALSEYLLDRTRRGK